jgi:hypothetical protein
VLVGRRVLILFWRQMVHPAHMAHKYIYKELLLLLEARNQLGHPCKCARVSLLCSGAGRVDRVGHLRSEIVDFRSAEWASGCVRVGHFVGAGSRNCLPACFGALGRQT